MSRSRDDEQPMRIRRQKKTNYLPWLIGGAVALGLVLTVAAGAALLLAWKISQHARTSQVIDNQPDPRQKIEVLVFTAQYCHVCRNELPPVLKQLRREFPTMQFTQLDEKVDKNLPRSVQYKVDAVPYFIVLIDGREAGRHRGVSPAKFMAEFLRDTYSRTPVEPPPAP
jgi:hypothetical protein